jgi:hypothetical protein
MADPMTLAMVGAAAGAMTNKKDPMKGALMGAALGGGGGLLAGGALAGGGAAAAPSTGLLAGMSPMGVQAAGGLTASAIPASGVAGGGALLAGGAPAAPGMMSRLANPQTLMAGAQLAGAMGPQPAQTAPGRVIPGQQIPMAFQPPPMAMSQMGFPGMMRVSDPLDDELGMFDVPSFIRSQMQSGGDDRKLGFFPAVRNRR